MTQFAAIVLAGQRETVDPLAEHTGASCKALVEIHGIPLLLRVLDALRKSAAVTDIQLGGPQPPCRDNSPALKNLLRDEPRIQWRPPADSPSLSAGQLMQGLPADRPVLLTTSDLAFPSTNRFDSFCERSLKSGADVCIGLAPYPAIRERFPELRKTVLRFRDGDYCGCNLFAFLTPQGRAATDRWCAVEAARKSPLKVIRILGLWSLLRYRLGWLSLDEALERLSRRFGLRIRAIVLEDPEAAIDIDSIDDYETLRPYLAAAAPPA